MQQQIIEVGYLSRGKLFSVANRNGQGLVSIHVGEAPPRQIQLEKSVTAATCIEQDCVILYDDGELVTVNDGGQRKIGNIAGEIVDLECQDSNIILALHHRGGVSLLRDGKQTTLKFRDQNIERPGRLTSRFSRVGERVFITGCSELLLEYRDEKFLDLRNSSMSEQWFHQVFLFEDQMWVSGSVGAAAAVGQLDNGPINFIEIPDSFGYGYAAIYSNNAHLYAGVHQVFELTPAGWRVASGKFSTEIFAVTCLDQRDSKGVIVLIDGDLHPIDFS